MGTGYRLVALLAAFAGLAIVTPGAWAVVVREPNGRFLSVQPRDGVTPASIPGSLAARRAQPQLAGPGRLSYNGGPVLHSSAPYLIFWVPSGESTPSSSSRALMGRYFGDVSADSGGSSNVYGVARQFTDGAGFADYRHTFNPGGQAILDTQPFPSNGCSQHTGAYPRCLSDAQLQAELIRLIGADGLPTGTGANPPIYFIVTPDDVNVCADSVNCASNAFCAYHGFLSAPDGSTALYAAIPFFLSTNPSDTARYAKACQRDGNSAIQEPNGDLADVAISYMSHEDNETITDPLPPEGWTDPSGLEDGDECAGIETNGNSFLPALGGSSSGSLFDQAIDGHPYYIQSEWSNGDGACDMRPSPGSIAPRFTVPPPRSTPAGATATFDPAPSAATNGITSATWNFGDGSPPQFLPGAFALVPASHSYGRLGRYGVTLTLVDDRGNVTQSTQTLFVGASPVARFTSSPRSPTPRSAVHFDARRSTDPDAGVGIASYHWTFGDGASGSGATTTHAYKKAGTYTVTVTVTNSLGISATVSHRLTIVRVQIIRIRVRKHGTSATLLITVNGPGRISIGRRTHRVKRAGTVRFTIALTGAQAAALGQRHTFILRVRVRFAPRLGKPSTKTVRIAFHR